MGGQAPGGEESGRCRGCSGFWVYLPGAGDVSPELL